jgi:hypothetical protein
MANAKIEGRLKDVVKQTYTVAKQAITNDFTGVTLSVGARLQANNADEIIITHTGHNVNFMKGAATKHIHQLSVVCFSKSYTQACDMADKIFYYFSDGQTGALNALPGCDVVFEPESQNLYYTDEDDFAAAVVIRAIVTDRTNL